MFKLQVIGNLGKDATVNDVNGKKVINFTVAHTDKYTDKNGQKQEKTSWIDCALWANSDKLAPYLTKGTQVFVEGEPSARGYKKQDDSIGASLSVRVLEVKLLGGNRNGNTSAAANSTSSTPANNQGDEFADDLPF